MPIGMLKKDGNTNTIFFTRYFRDINEVSGGYGERIFGLYGTYAKKYSCDKDNIYIYSEEGNKLFQCIGENFIEIKKGCSVIGLVNFVFSRDNCKLILAWPNLKLITIMIGLISKIIKKYPLILDLHDLPLEQSLAFGSKVCSLRRFILYWYTKLILHYADCLFSVSDAFRDYLDNKYDAIDKNRSILPNGTFPELLHSYKIDGNQSGIKICYSGSLLRDKGVPELIKLVDDLRTARKDIKLELWGYNGMEIENSDWLTVGSTSFSQMKEILSKADVLIIPFPKRLYFDLAHPIKLSDYMAAGKPIVCLNLETTGFIVNKYQCGIVCNNYEEMYKALLKLNDDKQLREKMGENGYKAAKQNYDWSVIAQNMHEYLEDVLKQRFC